MFSTGRIAMVSRGHWPINVYAANNFHDYDVQYMPRNRSSRSVFGVAGYGIAKDSTNKDLAWEMIKELVSDQSMAEIAGAGVAIPARRSATMLPSFMAEPQNAGIFYASIDNATAVPAPANFSQMEDVVLRMYTQIMTNAAPVGRGDRGRTQRDAPRDGQSAAAMSPGRPWPSSSTSRPLRSPGRPASAGRSRRSAPRPRKRSPATSSSCPRSCSTRRSCCCR
jgi:hypothetical protein